VRLEKLQNPDAAHLAALARIGGAGHGLRKSGFESAVAGL